jgi:hypothetical protein
MKIDDFRGETYRGWTQGGGGWEMWREEKLQVGRYAKVWEVDPPELGASPIRLSGYMFSTVAP